ncbi:MAG: MaoC family dehydratase N-terminal domain-containing protein [Pseudomonadota bacterium]
MIDYDKLMAWPFPAVRRDYDSADAIRFARGFGAGRGGALQLADQPYLARGTVLALPMIAVPLADGEFWQQRPETGIDWRQIIHAEEALTVHRPIPACGTVVITQRIEEIFDRGAEKGAVMLQKQFLHDADGQALATIDVTTMLRGNGGFGGKPYAPAKLLLTDQRAPDCQIELQSADDRDAVFRLSAEIKAAAGAPPGKSMMRGVGGFGTAGRAILQLVCGNQPTRLKRLAVRYAGPMYTDEVLRVELWRLAPGKAVFRMSAPGRNALVLNNSYVEFEENT